MDRKWTQVMDVFEDFSWLTALTKAKLVPYGRVVDKTLFRHVFSAVGLIARAYLVIVVSIDITLWSRQLLQQFHMILAYIFFTTKTERKLEMQFQWTAFIDKEKQFLIKWWVTVFLKVGICVRIQTHNDTYLQGCRNHVGAAAVPNPETVEALPPNFHWKIYSLFIVVATCIKICNEDFSQQLQNTLLHFPELTDCWAILIISIFRDNLIN